MNLLPFNNPKNVITNVLAIIIALVALLVNFGVLSANAIPFIEQLADPLTAIITSIILYFTGKRQDLSKAHE